MRLGTVSTAKGPVAVALLSEDKALNLAEAAHDMDGLVGDILRLGTLQAIIDYADDVLPKLRSLVAQAENGEHTSAILRSGASFLAPIPHPRKNVFCVGRNYAEHIAEGERAQQTKIGITQHPVYFTKPATAVIGHEGDVLLFPTVSLSIDYEVELAVVIGKAGRNITKDAAYDHIFGYTILNDITARDVQRRHGGQYFKGKGLDGSCPIGPWIVTADEIADPQDLAIRLSVNGEIRQDGQTRDMIFDIPTLIASLSEGLTLEPGDILATGTPSGVGYAMDPPQFLKAGDIIICDIPKIGKLRNTVRSA